MTEDEEDIAAKWDAALAEAPLIGRLDSPEAIDEMERWWEGFRPQLPQQGPPVERRQYPRSTPWRTDFRYHLTGAAYVMVGVGVLGLLAWMWSKGLFR